MSESERARAQAAAEAVQEHRSESANGLRAAEQKLEAYDASPKANPELSAVLDEVIHQLARVTKALEVQAVQLATLSEHVQRAETAATRSDTQAQSNKIAIATLASTLMERLDGFSTTLGIIEASTHASASAAQHAEDNLVAAVERARQEGKAAAQERPSSPEVPHPKTEPSVPELPVDEHAALRPTRLPELGDLAPLPSDEDE
jgi:hypothetical protein